MDILSFIHYLHESIKERRLDKITNHHLIAEFNMMQSNAGLKQEAGLFIIKDDKVYARVSSPKRVVISTSALQSYKETPYLLRYILGHEVAHLMYGDEGNKARDINNGIEGGNNFARAISLLREVRANMAASNIANLNFHEQKAAISMLINQFPERQNKFDSYKHGYPTWEQMQNLMREYSSFSESVIFMLLQDFCSELRLNNQDAFIKRVETIFKQQYHHPLLS